MPPKADKKHSKEHSHKSPLEPSNSVKEAWGSWKANTDLSVIEQERVESISSDVVKIVYDFGKDLSPRTYEAIHLASLIYESTSPDPKRRALALQALKEFVSNKPNKSEYVPPFTADIRKINSFLDHHWDHTSESMTYTENDDEPTERQYSNPWACSHEIIPLRDVLELVSEAPNDIVKNPGGVNIESILLGAGLAYETLRNAGRVSEDQLLRTVYDVDTFYRPLLEIIGYDGFVMALKREVILIRMSRNGGKYDGITQESLDLARDMLRKLPPAKKIPGVVDNVVSKLTLKDVDSESILRDTSGHGIQFGTGRVSERDMLDIEDSGSEPIFDAIRYIWRIKSDTEIARKIAKQIKQQKQAGLKDIVISPITDILGITVVVPSIDTLSDQFLLAVSRTTDAVSLQPTHTPGRPTAFHAKGEDVIASVDIDFGSVSNGEELDKKQSFNNHKVAKITLQLTPDGDEYPVPVEIQFQTKEHRIDARVGPAAHTFKLDGYNITDPDNLRVLKLLSLLYKRRRAIYKLAPTDISLARGQELFYGHVSPPDTTIINKDIGAAGIRTFLRSDSGIV